MERSPLLSPLQTAPNHLKSSRIHSTVSSPGGVQSIRSSSRSPPPPNKPRSESHDRSFANTRKHYKRSRSQERDERSRPRDFPNTDRRRLPRNAPVTHSNRNLPDVSPPLDMGFQESPRPKFQDRFQQRDRFRMSESLKNSPIVTDHSGQSGSSRYFGPSSAPSSSTMSHSRDFSPPANYKSTPNEINGVRAIDYYSNASSNMVGLGLGPTRYGDRDDWRWPGQFREFERERDFRGRDGRDNRQDNRDIRDSRPPRDPRDNRELRDVSMREREQRDRDISYQRDPDFRDRDHRDLRETGITTREFRERENRERDSRERGFWNSDVKSRDGLDQESRDFNDRDRERDRERERNRDRPNWIRDQDKDYEVAIPTRPALDQYNREKERERERQTGPRPLASTELDREPERYGQNQDKTRHSFGRMEDSSRNPNRSMSKSSNFSNTPSRYDIDDKDLRDRSKEWPSFNPREEERETFNREYNTNGSQREHELNNYSRQDGAGLRSDGENRQKDFTVGRRQRILSAPSLDGGRYGELAETNNRDRHHLDRNSYPNSPATSTAISTGSISTNVDLGVRNDDHRQTHEPKSTIESTGIDLGSSFTQNKDALVKSGGEDTEIADKVDKSRYEFHPSLVDKNSEREADSGKLTVGQNSQSVKKSKDVRNWISPLDDRIDVSNTINHAKIAELNGVESTSNIPTVTAFENKIPAGAQDLLDESRSTNGMNQIVPVSNVVLEKESATSDIAHSPSMASLPSPGLSPALEKTAVESLMDTADILEGIDTIDKKIKHFEELLKKHKEQKEIESELHIAERLDSIEDEDVAIDIEQPDSESVLDDAVMGVDDRNGHTIATSGLGSIKNEDFTISFADMPSPAELVPDRDIVDSRSIVDNDDIDMETPDADNKREKRRHIAHKFLLQELQQPIDEDDPFYKRKEQKRRPQLFDQIYAENNNRAKKYGKVFSTITSSVENNQVTPKVYESIEDYPCYHENIASHSRLRSSMLRNMSTKAAALDEKELELKKEYKQYWESWTKKVEKLEKAPNLPVPANVREEDLVQSDNVLFTTRNRRGAYNSDAVRSEAELLEIIQSLENADMKNPDLRASRTAATVPPMILDPNIRNNVRYFDRNHLVTDPAKYYRLGPVTDIWTEEERQIFIKRYLNYPKQFGKIAAGIENKTASQCVLFYYREKKKIGFKDMVSNRGRKRKPAAGKRKEKVAQPSPSGQPGKKHKGSALIEDIGQANRKQAKSKEVRELHDLHQNWADFDGEPLTRRRVRSGAVAQQSTPNPDDSSNVSSPLPLATSTSTNTAAERRKQRSKATNTRSSASVALDTKDTKDTKNAKDVKDVKESKDTKESKDKEAKDKETKDVKDSKDTKVAKDTKDTKDKVAVDDVVVEEKKSKSEKSSSTTTATQSNSKVTSKAVESTTDTESSKISTAVPPLSVASAPTPLPTGVARWTAAEQAKCKAALKKYGRDFEAVANAVGTKTVDQCKNFCFNYKRKFGVSALDDANNFDESGSVEEAEDKDITSSNKIKKSKPTGPGVITTSSTPQVISSNKDVGATPAGRRKTGKPITQEPIKDDSPKGSPAPTNNGEESETTSDKRRRRRAVSKGETGVAPTEPTSSTSFRARYSRDISESSPQPSTPAASQIEEHIPIQASVDTSTRRPNFSSYWSRQEKLDFQKFLNIYGKDWEKISKAMKTKTFVQVRNHYSNNAEKFANEDLFNAERTGSPSMSQKGDEENPIEAKVDAEMEMDNSDYNMERGDVEQDSSHYAPEESDHNSSYFMHSLHSNVPTVPKSGEQPRAATPPRRVTNIGNLLNNDDEDVNVAVEDWFGNNDEGDNPQSPEYSNEAAHHAFKEQEASRGQYRQYDGDRPRISGREIEIEDDYDVRRSSHGEYGSGASSGYRHDSESAPIHGYSSVMPSSSSYYGHHHQHPSQHHSVQSIPPVLGSPYDSQQYYRNGSHANSGYRSPPPPLSPPPGTHNMQSTKSPSIPIPTGPSSTIMQPSHYSQSHVSHHQQHQRSSSIGQMELSRRSNASPQADVRDRSPMPHQGSYFTQAQSHGYGQSPSNAQYGYSQNHGSHHPETVSTHSRHIHESSVMMHHSQGHSHGHSHSHSHSHGHNYGHSHSRSISRYSGSPQLTGSGSIRGSPGPVGPSGGPGSPAHLGHGGHLPSRYSPIPSSVSSGPVMSGVVGPVTSPRLSEPPVHQYQQHMRRSSSPYQHHIPGQVPTPSYLQPPPAVSHPPPSKHQHSPSYGYGPSTPTSIFPPPLPTASSAPYHSSHQQSSYGHSRHSPSPYGTPPPPHHHHQQPSGRHHQ